MSLNSPAWVVRVLLLVHMTNTPFPPGTAWVPTLISTLQEIAPKWGCRESLTREFSSGL